MPRRSYLSDPAVVGKWRFLHERRPAANKAPSNPVAHAGGPLPGGPLPGGQSSVPDIDQFLLMADGHGRNRTSDGPSVGTPTAVDGGRVQHRPNPPGGTLPDSTSHDGEGGDAREAAGGEPDSDDELMAHANARTKPKRAGVQFGDYVFQPGGSRNVPSATAHVDVGAGDMGSYEHMSEMQREVAKAMEDAGPPDEPAPPPRQRVGDTSGAELSSTPFSRRAAATPPADGFALHDGAEAEAEPPLRRTRKGGSSGMSPRLPPIVVDSSFTYAPKPKGRAPKYGAWYVPVKDWQVGGLAPPPEALTAEEKKAIEGNVARR